MERVLIAGRGAIAARAVESARAAGLSPVAVVSAADPQQAHALGADAVERLQPLAGANPYDDVARIVGAAVRSGAGLVHPGHGALAEDPELPRLLAEAGIVCAGAGPELLTTAGDKSLAVAAAERLGVPVLPHADGRAAIMELAARAGFPLVLKPRSGCYGQGVQVVYTEAQLRLVLDADPDPGAMTWYAERYVEDARIVGVTVAVDREGRVAHLGSRESLLVAGHLKLLDAAPVLDVPADMAAAMRRHTQVLAEGLDFRGVSSVEFVVSPDGYHFLEINPRLTGAYRMCETQTGIDLIALQLALAQGELLDEWAVRDDPAPHVVEARLFVRPDSPRPGSLSVLRLAERPGVSYACTLDVTRQVRHESMLVQVLATAGTREEAVGRTMAALAASEVSGIRHYGDEIAAWAGGHVTTHV
ncbi:biotin carboxylase N-terminal domain-containing protein [Streptomyces sp. NPDC056670]|uniref:ATP-binding protein n=1 Tax=Streptomyces sp. NPDC056670 TaxID=3345904 RepID=UPI0036ACA9E4